MQLTDADRARVAELNAAELLDRDATWALKRAVLQRTFDADPHPEGFRDWWWHQGQALQDWANWAAVADEHGADWHAWPADLRDPRGPEVREWSTAHEPQVAFHAWLQWLLDGQLTDATGDLTVIQDLPIGVSGGGADAWAWQDVLAEGVSVGAPRTPSTPAARTGAPRRWCPGGCGRRTTPRSWSRSGPPWPGPAACASTT